jgi:hypothetical protein
MAMTDLLHDPDFMAMALEGYCIARPRKYPNEYLVLNGKGGAWYFIDLNTIKDAWKRNWSYVNWWPVEMDKDIPLHDSPDDDPE